MALHVACAADESYVGHSAAMLHSLLVRNPGAGVEVHYLHPPRFDAAMRDSLRGLVTRHGGQVEFISIDDDAVRDLPTTGRIPRVMWYRVFLPDLLPGVDRVLYLDADTLVVDSLGPL